jgi:hypothetical protein
MYWPETPINLAHVKFNKNERPRGRMKQFGAYAIGYSGGWLRPRHFERLREFHTIAQTDSTVSYCLFVLIDTLLASLGQITHPDPEIEQYLRQNIERLGGFNAEDKLFRFSFLYSRFFRMIFDVMWAGFSTTEMLFDVDDEGKLWISDFITYHPASILVRTNRRGRLTDGEPSWTGLQSGIWQTGVNPEVAGEVRLPLWKVCHLVRNEAYGNYYGVPLIESAYRWCLYKEAFADMYSVALDRYGNPIIAITYPVYTTGQVEIDPETGQERNLTTQELIERQLTNEAFTGGGNVLLLPQVDPHMIPKVDIVTSGNNVGSMYIDAMELCNQEIARALLVPYGLVSNDPRSDGKMTQRQMELFNRILTSIHAEYIRPILSQTFHRLIKDAFRGRDSAGICPRMDIRQTTRPEDRVALMQMISGLTDRGYFNPMNPDDWKMVREMVDSPIRPQEPADRDFVNKMLIVPKMPPPAPAPAASSSKKKSGGTKRGSVKGQGVGAGRPIGTSAPKNKSADQNTDPNPTSL